MKVPPSTVKDTTSLTANKLTFEPNYDPEELKQLRFTRHVTAFDVDILALEEQPWRNKNVDISDFFNYGFNERTWMVSTLEFLGMWLCLFRVTVTNKSLAL
ncbi:hypothetical protein EON65_55010 [archaeon]|nr:MAG: hypothetical protein EON65_55010 [archaeon]